MPPAKSIKTQIVVKALLVIALIIRWLYPVWVVVGPGYESIGSHPLWKRPPLLDAACEIGYKATALTCLIPIFIAALALRMVTLHDRNREKRDLQLSEEVSTPITSHTRDKGQ